MSLTIQASTTESEEVDDSHIYHHQQRETREAETCMLPSHTKLIATSTPHQNLDPFRARLCSIQSHALHEAPCIHSPSTRRRADRPETPPLRMQLRTQANIHPPHRPSPSSHHGKCLASLITTPFPPPPTTTPTPAPPALHPVNPNPNPRIPRPTHPTHSSFPVQPSCRAKAPPPAYPPPGYPRTRKSTPASSRCLTPWNARMGLRMV